MLDDALLLTAYGLIIVIMTSCEPCHTIIHIQAYTYNHSMMLHTGMWRIPMRSSIWNIPMKSCIDSLVSAPASVQFSGLIVGSLASAPFTRAVYQSDGWILGLSNCHPCSARSRVRFCVFFITSLRPCHLCYCVSLNSKPTPSWQFDISPQALRSSFCFNLVVFRLVRLRVVPFSVPCCPSYFCFGLRCAWLNRFWLCIKLSTVTCCCLPTRFADQSSRVCPCSSFRPQCRDVSFQYDLAWCSTTFSLELFCPSLGNCCP